MKYFWNITGFLCLVFFAAGISRAEPFRIGTWKTAQTIQPYFYQSFLPVGTICDVTAFTNPADQKTALLAGKLDMCGVTLPYAIYCASIGQPVVVVASLCNKASALVIRKGVPVRRISDLKGKRIGYPPGTMDEMLLREALKRHKLIPGKNVHLIRVDFFEMGNALAKGSIDAFLSGEPFPTLAVRNGYGRILSYPYYDDSIGTINTALMVTRQSLKQHPERVMALVKAHALATRYLTTHPDEWFQKAASFGVALGVVRKSASNIELTWEIDPDFIESAKALGARMMALKLIDRQPNYEKLFDLTCMKHVKRELVK
jgi:NitT/TauT family transport system substrate-binding protein